MASPELADEVIDHCHQSTNGTQADESPDNPQSEDDSHATRDEPTSLVEVAVHLLESFVEVAGHHLASRFRWLVNGSEPVAAGSAEHPGHDDPNEPVGRVAAVCLLDGITGGVPLFLVLAGLELCQLFLSEKIVFLHGDHQNSLIVRQEKLRRYGAVKSAWTSSRCCPGQTIYSHVCISVDYC